MVGRSISAFVVIAALSLLACARPALAGYVTWLIHPFDIGKAESLPWDAHSSKARADYDLATLIPDTEALLTPSTPIVVRLETLRRAVIYASRDRQVAERLLSRFTERVFASENAASRDGLACLDAAFVTDALWQIGQHSNPPFTELSRQVKGIAGSADGYELVKKGLAQRPDDPAYEFGAALIAGVRRLGSVEFIAHTRRAIVAATHDDMLARNLDRIYADQLAR
jgi:hypothetical protein